MIEISIISTKISKKMMLFSIVVCIIINQILCIEQSSFQSTSTSSSLLIKKNGDTQESKLLKNANDIDISSMIKTYKSYLKNKQLINSEMNKQINNQSPDKKVLNSKQNTAENVKQNYDIQSQAPHRQPSLPSLLPQPSLLLLSQSSLQQSRELSLELTLSNYSNPNDNFKPSSYMILAATITQGPLLFTFTQQNLLNILLIPVIIFGLGILAFLFLNIGLFFRCCCFCCKCLPKLDNLDDEERRKKLKYHRDVILSFFIIGCIFTLVADQLSYIGTNFKCILLFIIDF